MHRWVTTLAVAASVASCRDPLPPHGEVVVVVDTDLPVPALVGRLRADVFSKDGRWLSSRDFALPRASDWPASFSVFSQDEQAPREAVVRLRGYPDGKLRDYLGERYLPRPPYVERYADSLDALCSDLPELELGREITLRRGADKITDRWDQDDCPYAVGSGAVAARVRIDEAATYRFAVIRSTTGQSSLWLRSQCAVESSEIACADNATTSDPEPEIFVHLEPGVYTLMQSSYFPYAPADVVLRGARADAWDDPPAPAVDPYPLTPRLVIDGVDRTPASEPQPRLAVDRLVRVTLTPGRVAEARVVLEGACAGRMSRLAASEVVDALRLDEAETCAGGSMTALSPAALGDPAEADPPRPAPFVAVAPCDDPGDDQRACVPGGAFILGGPASDALLLSALPERPAVMSRFWIDRYEVTVARMRAALAAGLVLPYPLHERTAADPQCTWTASLGAFEDFALSCIDWYQARAFCQWAGGDLPTEAQWEYVAAAAGRAQETRYPLGDEAPQCSDAAVGLDPLLTVEAECTLMGVTPGPKPIAYYAETDRTPVLGVVGMTGAVMEHTRDSGQPYDHPCWDATGLVDPACEETTAPLHVLRGGTWMLPRQSATSAQRFAQPGRSILGLMGFRCAYDTPP